MLREHETMGKCFSTKKEHLRMYKIKACPYLSLNVSIIFISELNKDR